ncbi:PH domain-containing protein [Levilactobacillus namurensis]|nr:PH domain-containing protein [Levilactobacillus namurensis]
MQGQYAARNTAGSLLTHQLLVLQTGHFWTRETFFVRKAQIQSLRVTWSVWMQKRQLAHLTVNIRHGNHNQEITLRYISAKQAERLYQWYKA